MSDTHATAPHYLDDAYAARVEASIVAVRDEALVLDRTVFYPRAGGQPGDTGALLLHDGRQLPVLDTLKGERPGEILHVIGGAVPPAPGTHVTAALDWPRRHRLMRMHTALHLLCAAVDGAVTGGQIGEDKSRLDFDLDGATAPDKDALAAQLNAWIARAAPVTISTIDDGEFDARPELVRTMRVKPPRGSGRVRLVEIAGIDLQACGGTHVATTGEIGQVRIGKIENKGKQNRRIALHLAD